MPENQNDRWNDRNPSSSQGQVGDELDTARGESFGVESNSGAPEPVQSNWLGDAERTESTRDSAFEEEDHRRADRKSDQGQISTGEGSEPRGGWIEAQPGDLGSGQSGMGNNPPIDIIETGSDLRDDQPIRDSRTDPDFGGGGDLSGNSRQNQAEAGWPNVDPSEQNSGRDQNQGEVHGGAGDRHEDHAPGDLASDNATGTTSGNLSQERRPGETNTMNIGGPGSVVGETQTSMQEELGSSYEPEQRQP